MQGSSYLSHVGNSKNHFVMSIVMWICVHPYKATHFKNLKRILHFIAFMVLHTDYYHNDHINHRISMAWFLVWMLAYRSRKIVFTLIQRRQKSQWKQQVPQLDSLSKLRRDIDNMSCAYCLMLENWWDIKVSCPVRVYTDSHHNGHNKMIFAVSYVW